MSTPTIDQPSTASLAEDLSAGFDPFDLDITFIEDTPAADTILMCSTNDTCGSSCPSACTTS
ncbi:FxLD family lanthipeptide [Frankia sp. AgB1.9]|uniref:FxLD family lanthipeptide n=1 Tax=unclassified Frankia TaxID=2632575 RepID=UPI00193122EB|nr:MULTISPECIES: FxLD family lanthipeptide [unclassified Frankia]MBL7490886.1 FxLD family lanthipeptide [Frankia sp. AgW1.1]MBL7548326.1 FxLD family lanthipeptide [Frankia sp. AgB1.9]MBL7619034.1 FxLD family lanthipeptide [Frankia sp. AgB1.8]